ncbi:MAG TPA: 23S rRNA (adenine(2503)-C(2))-methyltransferase RlmN [Clostridiales bacterium]|nr:23S rRNA (adenine(2503)-C(2))-methyltransferase RlmN [Clostridiales bacterium]
MRKGDILSLSLAELEEILAQNGEQKFRAKQIYEWLHLKKVESFDEMTNISSTLRTRMNDEFYVNLLNISRKLESRVDNIVKYLYGLSDGNFIETVLMEYNHGMSLCISTQVGCKMGCKFCASTVGGFVRNLEPSEMLLQIYKTEKDSGKKISSIVLMGIGEPLDNFDNVIKFLQILSSKEGVNMSLRHVTVSTCGLVPMIDKLAELRLGLTLSVSLHASHNRTRSEIMPVNASYNIEKLISACKRYVDKTGRRVTFEYAVIDDVNSSTEEAFRLAELLRGMNCHVNLIPVNGIKERNYTSLMKTVQTFQNNLKDKGINVTIRRTLGSDINAACGQLRRDEMK